MPVANEKELNIVCIVHPGFYKGSMSNHDKVYKNLVMALHCDPHSFEYAIDGLKTVETIERICNSVSLS